MEPMAASGVMAAKSKRSTHPNPMRDHHHAPLTGVVVVFCYKTLGLAACCFRLECGKGIE